MRSPSHGTPKLYPPVRRTGMFGTLSFSNKGPSKNSKVLSFSHGGSGHSTRKFACEACRIHKVKCSGDQSGCARCVGLKVKCVYDRVSKSSSRSSLPQTCRNMSSTAGTKFSWRVHSLNKQGSPKHRCDELCPGPRNDSNAIFETADPVDKPLNELSSRSISPEWLTSASTGEVHTALQSHTRDSSSHSGETTAMDFIDATVGDFDHILDWTSENDKPENASPGLVAFPGTSALGNGLHPSPNLTATITATQQDPSLARLSQACEAFENPPSSPLSPCSCSSRLSTLLFRLSGHLRRYSQSASLSPPCGGGMQLGQSISFIFASHAGAARLSDDLMACGSECFAQGSNAVQVVMLIEQLVDLYGGLMEQLPVDSYAGDEQMAASVEMAIPVRVGEFIVESVAERRSIIALLVGKRLKAITGLTVRFRERLRNVPGQAGQCRERLHAAIQRLELLREG